MNVPTHSLTTVLAQTAGVAGKKGDVNELLLVIGILIGVLILGYVTIMFIRGRMKAMADTPPSVSLMDSVRQMHAEGKISDEEFSAVRAKMSSGLRSAVARPPAPGSTAPKAAKGAASAQIAPRPPAAPSSANAPPKEPPKARVSVPSAPASSQSVRIPAAPSPAPAPPAITRREQTSSGTRISAGPARSGSNETDGARMARDEADLGSTDLRDSSQQTHRGMQPPAKVPPKGPAGGTPVDRPGTEK
jgi:uncharacterized membrane protein